MNGIYGRAATGLANDSSFAANEAVAKIGATGELKTAAILDGFALKAAVLHDLRIPIPGFKSNIDHIVVSGNRVLIIDTKVWKPGFYWTLFGVNRRGGDRVDHTAKDQAYVRQAIVTYLRGTDALVTDPHLATWSSQQAAAPVFWLLKVPGAKLLHGDALLGFVKRFIGRTPADPVITRKLMELCVKKAAPVRPASYDQGFGSTGRRFAPAGPDPFA